jgi:hypothetical protein
MNTLQRKIRSFGEIVIVMVVSATKKTLRKVKKVGDSGITGAGKQKLSSVKKNKLCIREKAAEFNVDINATGDDEKSEELIAEFYTK